MVNLKLRNLMDRDELDWDDPRHRELYFREHVNKGGHAFEDEEDDPPGNDRGSGDINNEGRVLGNGSSGCYYSRY